MAKGSGGSGRDARSFVEGGGNRGAIARIPSGAIIRANGVDIQVERSNGYIITGRTRNNRDISIDLRLQNAKIVRKTSGDSFFSRGGQLGLGL